MSVEIISMLPKKKKNNFKKANHITSHKIIKIVTRNYSQEIGIVSTRASDFG